MYRRRRRRRAAVPRAATLVLAALLTLAPLSSAALVLPPVSLPRAAVYVGSFLSAPEAAAAAARQTVDDALAAQAPAGPEPEPESGSAPGTPPAQANEAAQPSPAQPQPETAQQPAASESAAPADGGQAAPAGGSASAQAPESDGAAPPEEPEEIPEGMAALLETHYAQGSGAGYVPSGAATVRNCTTLSNADIAGEMMQALPFSVEVGSDAPQVLIMHTHTTETYELAEHTWCDPAFSARSTDLSINMAAVGAEMAAQLNAAGICTLHDTTLHDYPSYNGSYAKSNATVRSYLERYPSIKVVIDVHRDAIQYDDGTRVKPIAMIDGLKSAQVMIICGADVNGNLPNFRQNLRFASRWQDKMESMFPGLTRPVLFDYRYYNQDLTTGSLLIEVGGHANTLEEAKYAGRLAGQALAALLAEEA